MNFFKRFFGHLSTVHRHRAMVRKLCFKCGLYWQGLTHDLSKYSPVEFCNGVKFYTGTKSPHIGEREEYGYSKAWVHHHNKNKHHLNYWTDIDTTSGAERCIEMPKIYFAEMICDRVAASMVYLGNNFNERAPLDYYKSHTYENKMNDKTRKDLELWLLKIANNGISIALKELNQWVQIP